MYFQYLLCKIPCEIPREFSSPTPDTGCPECFQSLERLPVAKQEMIAVRTDYTMVTPSVQRAARRRQTMVGRGLQLIWGNPERWPKSRLRLSKKRRNNEVPAERWPESRLRLSKKRRNNGIPPERWPKSRLRLSKKIRKSEPQRVVKVKRNSRFCFSI
jgi:hypothetical protein